ncbi:MAG: hypothetical protein E7A62_02705 [Actinomycetaceae bacterium]|nr:hypothetical protein [Actinomycetaceae bacterium]MDU0969891.1 hypothetical protein [Actinomycetaceae bacterium]
MLRIVAERQQSGERRVLGFVDCRGNSQALADLSVGRCSGTAVQLPFARDNGLEEARIEVVQSGLGDGFAVPPGLALLLDDAIDFVSG